MGNTSVAGNMPSGKESMMGGAGNTTGKTDMGNTNMGGTTGGKTVTNMGGGSNNMSGGTTNMEEDWSHYDYIESTYGQIQRSFTLPEDVEPSGLTAKYEDGVIKIHIPRLQTKQSNKQTITLQ
jgi:hypothetical protein